MEKEIAPPEFSPLDDFTLPPILQSAVDDGSRALGIDRDMVLPVGLAVISSSLMSNLRLIDEDGEWTPANIYTVLSAMSGTGKSRLFRLMAKVLYEIEAEAIQSHAGHSLPALKAEKQILENQKRTAKAKKGVSRAELLEEMQEIEQRLSEIEIDIIPPRLIVEDATVQKLAMMLQRSEKMSVFSPDARDVLLNITGRHNDSKADEGIFLKGFSLEHCTVDRIRRETVSLTEPCISMCLVVTPDAVEELFSNDRLLQGGFLPRCIFVNSQSKPRVKFGPQPGPEKSVWEAWDGLIRDLTRTYRAAQSPAYIKCSPQASEAYRMYWNDFAEGIIPQNSFTARNVEIAKRIALCLHAAEHGKRACAHELSADTASASIMMMEFWLSRERAALLSRATEIKDAPVVNRLTELLDRSGGRIPVRDLQSRHGYTGERLKDLERFVESSAQFQFIETDSRRGRPGKVLTYA